MSTLSVTYLDGIAVVDIAVHGERMNVLNHALIHDLEALCGIMEGRQDLHGLVFRSARPGSFIAGADIKQLRAVAGRPEAHAELLAMARLGQELMSRIAALPQTTVAAIDGACLGGGLELALACDARVASDGDKTVLGLPEVQLGILPGWGGTQRLPRLVGFNQAVELILAGKRLDARKALKLGLIDRVAGPPFLLAAALDLVARPPVRASRRPWWWLLLPWAPRLIAALAARQARIRTGGLMPAPVRAARVLGATAWGEPAAGLPAEAEALADLAATAQSANLIDAFFASESARKSGGEGPSTSRVGVLGAGVMGGGIAWAFAGSGVQVRVKDLAWDAVAKAHATVSDYERQLIRLRKHTPAAASVVAHRVSGTTDWSGFHDAELVVEAVVESLEVKRTVLAECEVHVPDTCVMASNTSSLTLAGMATALRRPQRLVGMHFFNPVNRMPLVEVVAHPGSDPEAVARVVSLVRRCGKTAIVVQDCPGFLVNRCLLPYLDEAARCLEDGADLRRIDQVLTAWGMPMGPFALCDEIGLDVGWKVARNLATAYGERMAVPDVLRRVYEDLHLTGAKGGKGFYLGKARDGRVNPQVTGILPHASRQAPSDAEIIDRCVLAWINEAARCLEEGVVVSGELCDLAMLMGTGFPPARGGPIHEANRRGVRQVVEGMRRLQNSLGSRFAPCALLLDHASDASPIPIHPAPVPMPGGDHTAASAA
jgi:3-hydroxyacyl-CoA dehydrogenase / enoyl-CoA hydratase / 3-hydroxybutyryl-CoA epimerase